MSFFSQLKDEMHDKNIDKTKLHDLTADLPEQQVQGRMYSPHSPSSRMSIRIFPIIRIISL